ncbi:MAG: excinuclease ABC subunit UvrC [Chloroflexi bacterium]|nr:excinuclease ABC subunit UvrC [Chloroflexota bacterium]
MTADTHIANILETLPTKPGVYLMKGATGTIIYVGKAISLRNRVRSYFHASADHPPKVRRMVEQIADIDFIVTGSELEALILENNLIKKHRPRYNVRLKDDKRYPYIKITVQEDYPHIYLVRRLLDDGARYFGPYTSSKAVHATMDLLRNMFPYLSCTRKITGQDKRACLYYYIGRCAGPCIGAVTKEEYHALIDQVCLFLEGKTDKILKELRLAMTKAAEELQFERAAKLRDQIQAVEQVIERQKVVSTAFSDQDVIAFARNNGEACVQVFFIRGGKLLGREYFVLTGTQDENGTEIMTSFVKQFYSDAAYVPPEILLQNEVDEVSIIQSWLKTRRGEKVSVQVPQRGKKRELVLMAAENATETLNHLRLQWEMESNRYVTALAELQEQLGLEQPPSRMECFDISNTQGQLATGSMVVFVQGVARKSDYRRFRVRSVQGADDYAMMGEVLRRRFRRAVETDLAELAGEPGADGDTEDTWSLLPDLLIVDGGKGQLHVATDILREFDLLERVPVIGLAKREEEVFVPGNPEPILLPRDSEGLFVLQRIRDEAHRFAVSYHRNLRDANTLVSELEAVPGIGPKRRRALIMHFGSVEAIREASAEELAAVPGMTQQAAEQVKSFF